MGKSSVNEKELTYEGCYGDKVTYSELDMFLDDCFEANRRQDAAGSNEKFAACIWGHSGIGKTAKVKQRAKRPLEWAANGDAPEKYKGHEVYTVPIAQMEEMGDFHGMPDRHVCVAKSVGSKKQEAWVPVEVSEGYIKEGWSVVHSEGIRTMYAPPDWVPRKPGPSILLLDDWNRASVRIIKGLMQLLQNYGMVSWSLPPGCNIVMTGNPDEQDYLVTSIDSAIITRIKSVTLKHDAREWSIWAQREGVDPRVISYVLQYPEMMIGKERTNPRTLSEVGRSIHKYKDLSDNEVCKRFSMTANSLLDEETVSALTVFMERDVEMVISPEDILAGKGGISKHMAKLMAGKEKRIDILGVTIDRLFAYMVQPEVNASKTSVKNFQDFLTMKDVPEDMRHNLCMRLCHYEAEGEKTKGEMAEWILHNPKLKEMILAVV